MKPLSSSSAPDKVMLRTEEFNTGAFSTPELLVVMAIIAALAIFLTSALNGWRQRAQGVVCINQLRQIGSVIHLYAQENNGRMPRTDSNAKTTAWYQALYPYFGLTSKATGQGIFRCPVHLPEDTTGHCYAMEYGAGVGSGASPPSITLASLTSNNGGIAPDKGKRWLLIDAGWHIIRAGNTTSANPRTAVRFRHHQRANVLFPDMTARSMSKAQINEELYLFLQTPIP